MTSTIVIAAAFTVFVAVCGGLLTKLTPWYYGLRFPSWKPPDWLFGPAWTVILSFACVAGTLGWDDAPNRQFRTWVVVLFGLNGFLNAFWSFLYFRLQRPDWALGEVILLQAINVSIAWLLYPVSPTASLCMAPYIVWVAFAGFLNVTIVRLNAPFGRAYRPSKNNELAHPGGRHG